MCLLQVFHLWLKLRGNMTNSSGKEMTGPHSLLLFFNHDPLQLTTNFLLLSSSRPSVLFPLQPSSFLFHFFRFFLFCMSQHHSCRVCAYLCECKTWGLSLCLRSLSGSKQMAPRCSLLMMMMMTHLTATHSPVGHFWSHQDHHVCLCVFVRVGEISVCVQEKDRD